MIVYVAGPLSGFQANTGQTVAGGVRLMAEQLNRSGGLLGYKVKVVALDDEADSDVAVTVAEQIKAAVERGDKVLGVIGHPNSGQTAAAMAIYKDLAIIVITPTASEVGLTKQGYPQLLPRQRRQRCAGEDRRRVPGEQAGRQEGRGALQRRLLRHRPGQAGCERS